MIPVCVKSGRQSQCFLLTQRRQQSSLKGCSNFVFPDAGALGYYRFDYDTDALHRLSADAEKTLTPEERIALLRNEWALMRAGKHKASDYLVLGAQFKNTPGQVLLDDFAMHLEFINDNLVSDSDRPQFQVWLRQTFSPMLQKLGYAAHPDDMPTVRQKRAILFEMLGNVAEDPQVIAQAGTLIQQYMSDPQSVDGTLARAVVQVAARHGNAELYAQFKAKMKDAKTPEQYYRYFYALGQFRQPDVIKQTLEATLTPEVRSQDLYVLPSMMENQAAQDQTWEFMRQNFNELEKKAGGGLGGFRIFFYAMEGFCSEEKAQQVEQFFQRHPFPGTERNQKEALETINSCVSLRGQQQTKLAVWLKQNAPLNAAASSNATAGSNRR